MDIQMRPMVGRTEEVRSYPRQQNAGAPQGGYNQGSQGSGGNGGGNFGPKAISFDAPQPSHPQTGTPFPSAAVPSMEAHQPWNSNRYEPLSHYKYADRKSGVEGKKVSGLLTLVGRRSHK